eukprot:TRINITY_DN1186_c0_g1_i1.p1 TRINITY_DN1186_c0_g1~~TRINITY_DN1186_c0_g1_i1.p1  ORF type:complete len:425 (+),score=69.80 TRINITY_DN1186_c0_g1_i1:101-1375(+)
MGGDAMLRGWRGTWMRRPSRDRASTRRVMLCAAAVFFLLVSITHIVMPYYLEWRRVQEFWHGQDESEEMMAVVNLLKDVWAVELWGTLYWVRPDELSYKAIRPEPTKTKKFHRARHTKDSDILRDALGFRVQPQLSTNESAYFLALHGDSDHWHPEDGGHDPVVAERYRAFTAAHPNIFFLNYSPGLANPERGLIGPNVIPIPDFYPFPPRERPGPCVDRKPELIWRGSTTGFPSGADYKQTDRYRAVAFLSSHNRSDAKFVNVVQGVAEDMIAADMKTQQMMQPSEMAEYRVQLDVDGNSNAWGFRQKLAFGSAVVKVVSKSSPTVQWFYPYLEDRVHVLLTDVEGLKETVNAALDPEACDALGAQAGAFYTRLLRAHQHPKEDASGLSLYSILGNFRSYAAQRDWRIRSDRNGQVTLRLDET